MKILAAIDQSRRAAAVLPYAKKLAKSLDATLALVQAVPFTRSLLPKAMRGAEAYVSAVLDGLREERLAVEGFVQRGDAASVIVSMAVNLEADLVIMTMRGRAGLEKFMLGSVASAVLALCATPVLILKEQTEAALSDEDLQMRSAYMATVIWNKQAKGIFSKDEAEKELVRLAARGLDDAVLRGTYKTLQQGGEPFRWLDLDFQPDAAHVPPGGSAASGEELPPDELPDIRAA
jgi:nucleotide-binding universal stress UspA family protein